MQLSWLRLRELIDSGAIADFCWDARRDRAADGHTKGIIPCEALQPMGFCCRNMHASLLELVEGLTIMDFPFSAQCIVSHEP